MAESSELSTRLRALRDKRGLSLRQVADRVGVTAPCVFKWERGIMPRKAHLDALATALLVSPEYLVSGDEGEVSGALIKEAIRQAKHLLAERTGFDPKQIIITIKQGSKTSRPR